MKMSVAFSNSVTVHYSTVLMPSVGANNVTQNTHENLIQINTQFN